MPDGIDLPRGSGTGDGRRRRVVAVVMGSSSDLPVMQGAVEMLERFGVAHEVRVVSAHRTPATCSPSAKRRRAAASGC